MSKTFQGWLVTSVLAKIYHVRNTSRKQEAKVSARKGTVERAATQKEIPFEQSLSKTSTIPINESFKQPQCLQNEKLI